MDQDKTDKLPPPHFGGKQCPACGLAVDATVLTCPHDGTSLVNPIDKEPEFKDKYEFLGPIGVGGMGVIYKARQTALNKLVAIKMLHPHMVSTEAFRRFQMEGRAVSLLQHRYIINVHDLSITESGQPFMVMDFVEGRTLAQVIERDGPLSTERFLRIFEQICDALAHAHSRGVLHRDLKPSNIMLTLREGQEEVRIMDFGIAKLIDAAEQNGSHQLTRTGDTIGSPQYMSPEQARGGKTDKRSDLYSLGCVMYEALTGAAPFSAATSLETMMMHLYDKPVSMSQSLLGKMEFNPDLETIVARLLEKDPDLRYQSMGELQAALQRVQSGRSLDKFTDTAPERKINWPAIAIGVVIGAVVTAGVGVVEFNLSRKTAPAPVQLAPQSNLPTKAENKSQIEAIVKSESRFVDLGKVDFMDSIENDDIAPLENARRAVEMNLHGAHINDLGLQHISKLQLQKLSLKGTEVQDLHALKNMTTLKDLDVSYTPLNDNGMRLLGRLPNLIFLDISKTGIVDNDLHYLTALTSLSELYVRDCDYVTMSGRASLQSKLPYCTFEPAADPLIENANQLRNRGKFAEAAQIYAAAIKNLRQSLHPIQGVIARCLKLRAECFHSLGDSAAKKGNLKESERDYSERIQFLQQAEQILEKGGRLIDGTGTAGLRELCEIYIDHAAALEARSGWAPALVLRDKVNALTDVRLAEDSLMIDNLARLASDCNLLNKKDRAEALYKKAIQRYQNIGKGDSDQCGYVLYFLADLYSIQRKFKEALPYYEQARKILRRYPIWDTAAADGLRFPMALTEDSLGNEAEAESLLKEIISHQPKLKPAYLLLISVLSKEHKQAEAAQYEAKLKALR